MTRWHLDPLEKFCSHVVVSESGCWLWTGYLNPDGYGYFYPDGNGRMQPAHRWAYEFFFGDLPAGLQPDHECRVRACANPTHLEAVTSRENTLRGMHPSAVAARTGVCKRGHDLAGTYVKPDGGRQCRACRRHRYKEAG